MADALQREANKAREYQGKRLSPKRAMAAMSWDGILNGEVVLSNGSKIVLSEEGWLSLLKFVYIHLDGPVKPEPEPLDVVNWTPDEWRKEAVRRNADADNTLATFDDE